MGYESNDPPLVADIVERLRKWDWQGNRDRLEEAATEIERLREENKQLRAMYNAENELSRNRFDRAEKAEADYRVLASSISKLKEGLTKPEFKAQVFRDIATEFEIRAKDLEKLISGAEALAQKEPKK